MSDNPTCGVLCPHCLSPLRPEQDGSRTMYWCEKCQDHWGEEQTTISSLRRQLAAAVQALEKAEARLHRQQDKYPAVLHAARAAAQDCGYAIGLHGSESRDLDLIAVPWVPDAKSAKELVDAIASAVGGIINDPEHRKAHPKERQSPETKFHGRVGWSICVAGGYIDLSVMPLSGLPMDFRAYDAERERDLALANNAAMQVALMAWYRTHWDLKACDCPLCVQTRIVTALDWVECTKVPILTRSRTSSKRRTTMRECPECGCDYTIPDGWDASNSGMCWPCEITTLTTENTRLREVIQCLLDGLDANTQGECEGISSEQWERRIKVAREALEGRGI